MAPVRRLFAFIPLALALPLAVAGLSDCAGPTAIDVEVYSEVPCATNAEVALTVADGVSGLAGRAPSSYATRCETLADGTVRRGNVVIVPQDSKDKQIAFQLTTRNDAQPVASTCGASTKGCISARRQLRFLANDVQTVRVDLRLSCLDVDCPASQTCVKGQCVGADLAGVCSNTCDETTLTPDGGIADAGRDVDADADAALDAGPAPTALAAGSSHACAITVVSGTPTLRCWGSNDVGQLGDGTKTTRPTPVTVNVGGVPTQVVANGMTTCALLSTGAVRCWGNNSTGAVGDGTFTERLVPTAVVGLPLPVIALAAGSTAQHNCALLSDRSVRCWGSNGQAQLGDSTVVNRSTPVQVPLGGIVEEIAVGFDFTCARAPGGSVVCWGGNGSGQLGDGTNTQRRLPEPVTVAIAVLPDGGVVKTALSGATALAAGSDSTCAIVAGGLRCWGDNGHGQLGDGTQTSRSLPITPAIGTANAVEVSMSALDTCIRRATGAITCWGENASGQIGDGTRTQRLVPTNALGITPLPVRLAVGNAFACARLTPSGNLPGTVGCWGINGSGQLGQGALVPADSVSAVIVTGL